VVLPGAGGLASTVGAHGRGGVPASGRPAGGRGGVSTSSRGGGPTGSFSPALAPGKGKQLHVILYDDEVSSDEDEPLQKRLWWLSGAAGLSRSRPAPTMPDAAAAVSAMANKQATDKRATEQAVVTRAAKEATENAAADKEDIDKSTADEVAVTGVAVGAVGDSLSPGRAPSLVAGTKRVATPSGTTPAGQTTL
jgi:hypothetical protein